MTARQRPDSLLATIGALMMFIGALLAAPAGAAADADLAVIDLHEAVEPVGAGGDLIYALNIANLGDVPASDALLRLALPPHARFRSASPAGQCALREQDALIECRFEAIARRGEAGSIVKVRVALAIEDTALRSLALAAEVSSPDDALSGNNRQALTTTMATIPAAAQVEGIDLAITALRPVRVEGTKEGEVAFDIVVRNYGTIASPDARLAIALPASLRLAGPLDAACSKVETGGGLSCALGAVQPFQFGGESPRVRLLLAAAGAEQGVAVISAEVTAAAADTLGDNNRRDYNLTYGPEGLAADVLDDAAVDDSAPATTAAVDDATPPVTPDGDGSASGGIAGSGVKSGASTGWLGLFGGFTKSAPSGGNVDFLIASFETDPVEFPAGGLFNLNAGLENGGPGIATNARLDITLPSGVSFVSVTPSPQCAHDGGSHILCSFGDLAATATQNVQAVLRAAEPGRIVKTFSALIASDSDETNAANNSQIVNATIANGADLRLAATGAPNPAVAGGNVTYALTVDNIGLNIAQGARVVFNLPAGISYVSSGSGGSGWSCAAAGQVVTCTSAADISANTGTVSFNIVGHIGGGSGSYTASGTVTSLVTPDVDGSNDTTSTDISVEDGTDLSVTKFVSENPVRGGTQPCFTVRVTNNGPIDAQNLVMTDTLPAGFSHISAIGSGWSCALATQTVTCTRPSLSVGSSDIVITVDAPANGDIPEGGTNILNSASASLDTLEANTGNNTGSVWFALRRDGADLSVTLSRSPQPVAQGSDMTNTVTVRNNGPLAAAGAIRASYLMASGESYVSFSGGGWSFVGQVGNLLTFERASGLSSGANATGLAIVTRADGAGTLSSTACTSDDAGLAPIEGDPIASNNCTTGGLTATAAIADLVMGKTVSSPTVASTDNSFSYTLTVTNNGPDAADNVSLTDALSAYTGSYDDRPATGVAAAPSQGTCSGTSTMSCSLGTINNGASATVTITLTRPLQSGTIGNTASAYSSSIGDSNRSNNAASVNVSIDPVADIKLTAATVTPNPVKAGVEATYVLSVRNNGWSSAAGVTLQSLFTGDYTFISASTTKGSCDTFGAGAANRLDCSIGSLAFGENQSVTIVIRPNHQASPPSPWQVLNSTSVATTTHETNLANNTGGVTLDVDPAEIDLDVVDIDLVDPIPFNPSNPADNRVTYRLTVTNYGPSYATGVVLTDKFMPPAGSHRLKFVCDKAASGDVCDEATVGQICTGQGTIAAAGVEESIACAIGDLAANASSQRFLVYEVLDTPVPGGETHSKHPEVAANETDTVPANNSTEELTTVRIRADLGVACAAPQTPVDLREPYNLSLTVSNNGPGESQITTLSQTLPSGMVLTGAPTPASGSCSGVAGNTSFTCALGVLASGGSNVLTVPVRFTTYPSGGSYTYSASVTTNEIDLVSGNNSCTSATGTVTRASLAGYVYQDHNDDGDMDAGETAISGVTVRLTGTDLYGNAVNQTRTTSGTGTYSFTNLSVPDASGYTVTETHPTNYADGQENAGGSSVVSGSHASDAMNAIALTAGENKTHYDFGELPADIEVVSKTPSLASVSLREPFDFTIVVRNNGPADATVAALSDNLPANMTLTGAPTTDVGTCTGTAGGSSVSCAFGTLAVGAVANVTVPVELTAAGAHSNTASATTSRAEITTANNSRAAPVTATKSSIACDVYQDLDNDGVRDGGETGIGDVAMHLTGTDLFGHAVDLNRSTLGDGTCLFDNLSPSDASGYSLAESHPAGYLDGQENNNGSVVAGSDTSDAIAGIVLAANTHLPTQQFGEIPPTGISGTVWYDPDNDGGIDAGEVTRISGVTLTLDGTDDHGAVHAVTSTDANGFYSFTDLRPGTYQVSETQPATWLEGRAAVGTGAQSAGTADNTGASATFGNVVSGVVLAADDTAVSYNFGELREASIAGLVYNDTNSNDTRDSGEPGIAGVTLTLTCTDHRGNAVNLTQATASDGSYAFEHLVPANAGGCTLAETQPAGYVDGVDVAGSLGGTLANDTLSAIPLASADAGTGYDFAERSAGISGHVYVDHDGDGVLDGGELPIHSVSIELTGTDANGDPMSRTTTTLADGSYLFTGLPPSDANGYRLRETQPIAYADGGEALGSAGGTLANDDLGGIVLASTAFGTDYDFGERGATLAGTVYSDLDNDGVQEGGEAGIPGVALTLACTDINGEPVSRNAITGVNGTYLFADLPASDATGCTIDETQPADASDGLDAAGSLGGSAGNDTVSGIRLDAGEDGVDYDFGETLANPARISGHVWHDGDHDRANNDNSPEDGWTVELLHRSVPGDCTSDFVIVASKESDANGGYAFEGVSAGVYDIRFRSPNGGYIYGGAESHGVGSNTSCGIGGLTVAAGDNILDQDLPLDPSGVVYDSLTRQPVAGATVTLAGPSGFDPDQHLVGGAANATQTTGADGYYQFLLVSTAPAGDYHLTIGQPAGYLPDVSAIIPACSNTLSVGTTPAPALVQASDTAPTLAAATHDPASCPASSAGLAAGAGSTQYYFAFTLDPGLPSANVVNNHIPLDPVTEGAFTLAKSTPKVNVSVGELVPYTITATNNMAAILPNIEIEDQIPPGFKYKRGSASIDGVRVEPVMTGRRLTFAGLTFAANATRTIRMMLVVGSGVSEGDYINSAWAENSIIQAMASNVATAKVRVTADPTFDCSGIIGKVFDDKNRDGYQNAGEPGLAGVRLATVRGLLVTTDPYGRYHIACADVPDQDWGSNFIMKLDVRTLPTGYRVTTENPRVIRLTRGKIGKLNFGVAIHRVVRLDITRDAFSAKGDELKREWQGGLDKLVAILDQGPSVLRIAYARAPSEDARTVRTRVELIRQRVTSLWRQRSRGALDIESEIYLSAKGVFK